MGFRSVGQGIGAASTLRQGFFLGSILQQVFSVFFHSQQTCRPAIYQMLPEVHWTTYTAASCSPLQSKHIAHGEYGATGVHIQQTHIDYAINPHGEVIECVCHV